VRAPNCINRLCNNYRNLFSSDAAMAESLLIGLEEARLLVNGRAVPNLAAMVEIQSALRKAAIAAHAPSRRGHRGPHYN